MSVKNKTNKNDKRSQKGRSMVEMLGVLAIVGVLSVGGVYGYGVAMKKHKANQLLHEASMQAATVSAQIMSGKDPTGLTDFGTDNNITLDTDSIAGNTTFKLKMTGIGFDVCTQMKNAKGGMVRDVDCDEATGDATITYYKNLATTEAEGEKSPTGGIVNSDVFPPSDFKDLGDESLTPVCPQESVPFVLYVGDEISRLEPYVKKYTLVASPRDFDFYGGCLKKEIANDKAKEICEDVYGDNYYYGPCDYVTYPDYDGDYISCGCV